MADAIDQAAQEAEQKKRALLSAIAQQGSLGAQQFAEDQKRQQQLRTDAVNQALLSVARPGAPSTAGAAVQSIVSRPFDLAESDASSAAASRSASLNDLAARTGAYFDSAAAAVPAIRAQTDKKVALARAAYDAQQAQAKAEAQARADQAAATLENTNASGQNAQQLALMRLALEDTQGQNSQALAGINQQTAKVGLQKAQEQAPYDLAMRKLSLQSALASLHNTEAAGRRAASSSASGGNYAGKGNPIADLLHGLGGATAAKLTLAPVVKTSVSDLLTKQKNTARRGGLDPAHDPAMGTGYTPSTATDLVGSQLGLAPGQLAAILGKSAPGAATTSASTSSSAAKVGKAVGLSAETVQQLRSDPKGLYSRLAAKFEVALQGIPATYANGILQDPGKPAANAAKKADLARQIRQTDEYRTHPKEIEVFIRDFLGSTK